jgi:hypothetical protein
MSTKIANSIHFLRDRQQTRALGYPVSYTDDPAWLVNMAINRRAGWPDDPTTTRGSAMPVNGEYPKKAAGDYGYRHLVLLARSINTRRLIVRPSELGEWRKVLLARIPERFE